MKPFSKIVSLDPVKGLCKRLFLKVAELLGHSRPEVFVFYSNMAVHQFGIFENVARQGLRIRFGFIVFQGRKNAFDSAEQETPLLMLLGQ